MVLSHVCAHACVDTRTGVLRGLDGVSRYGDSIERRNVARFMREFSAWRDAPRKPSSATVSSARDVRPSLTSRREIGRHEASVRDGSIRPRYSNCVATLLNPFTSARTHTHTHVAKPPARVLILRRGMAHYFTVLHSRLFSRRRSGHLYFPSN